MIIFLVSSTLFIQQCIPQIIARNTAKRNRKAPDFCCIAIIQQAINSIDIQLIALIEVILKLSSSLLCQNVTTIIINVIQSRSIIPVVENGTVPNMSAKQKQISPRVKIGCSEKLKDLYLFFFYSITHIIPLLPNLLLNLLNRFIF